MCFRDIEAAKQLRSSTPAVSPICTPSKQETKYKHVRVVSESEASFEGNASVDLKDAVDGDIKNKNVVSEDGVDALPDTDREDSGMVNDIGRQSDSEVVDSMVVEPGTLQDSHDISISIEGDITTDSQTKWHSSQRSASHHCQITHTISSHGLINFS